MRATDNSHCIVKPIKETRKILRGESRERKDVHRGAIVLCALHICSTRYLLTIENARKPRAVLGEVTLVQLKLGVLNLNDDAAI